MWLIFNSYWFDCATYAFLFPLLIIVSQSEHADYINIDSQYFLCQITIELSLHFSLQNYVLYLESSFD